LGAALLALFLLLFAQIGYLQVVAADRIADHPANAYRQLLAEYNVERGAILASDGRTVLARSRPSRGAFVYQRRYPAGALTGHVTGFYSLVSGRSDLEQSFND